MLALSCLKQVEWEVMGELKMSEEKMREDCHRWWSVSKYMQVAISTQSHEQIAQDAWQSACAHKESEFVKEREQLRALIAMQAEALKEIDTMVNNQGLSHALIARTLNASAESVAAWEAEKLEPLRREVAMSIDVLKSCDASPATRWDDAEPPRQRWFDKRKQALEDTQATAEAYERELKAKVLEEATEYFQKQDWRNCDTGKLVEDELMRIASELRAQSAQKKGGE